MIESCVKKCPKEKIQRKIVLYYWQTLNKCTKWKKTIAEPGLAPSGTQNKGTYGWATTVFTIYNVST